MGAGQSSKPPLSSSPSPPPLSPQTRSIVGDEQQGAIPTSTAAAEATSEVGMTDQNADAATGGGVGAVVVKRKYEEEDDDDRDENADSTAGNSNRRSKRHRCDNGVSSNRTMNSGESTIQQQRQRSGERQQQQQQDEEEQDHQHNSHDDPADDEYHNNSMDSAEQVYDDLLSSADVRMIQSIQSDIVERMKTKLVASSGDGDPLDFQKLVDERRVFWKGHNPMQHNADEFSNLWNRAVRASKFDCMHLLAEKYHYIVQSMEHEIVQCIQTFYPPSSPERQRLTASALKSQVKKKTNGCDSLRHAYGNSNLSSSDFQLLWDQAYTNLVRKLNLNGTTTSNSNRSTATTNTKNTESLSHHQNAKATASNSNVSQNHTPTEQQGQGQGRQPADSPPPPILPPLPPVAGDPQPPTNGLTRMVSDTVTETTGTTAPTTTPVAKMNEGDVVAEIIGKLVMGMAGVVSSSRDDNEDEKHERMQQFLREKKMEFQTFPDVVGHSFDNIWKQVLDALGRLHNIDLSSVQNTTTGRVPPSASTVDESSGNDDGKIYDQILSEALEKVRSLDQPDQKKIEFLLLSVRTKWGRECGLDRGAFEDLWQRVVAAIMETKGIAQQQQLNNDLTTIQPMAGHVRADASDSTAFTDTRENGHEVVGRKTMTQPHVDDDLADSDVHDDMDEDGLDEEDEEMVAIAESLGTCKDHEIIIDHNVPEAPPAPIQHVELITETDQMQASDAQEGRTEPRPTKRPSFLGDSMSTGISEAEQDSIYTNMLRDARVQVQAYVEENGGSIVDAFFEVKSKWENKLCQQVTANMFDELCDKVKGKIVLEQNKRKKHEEYIKTQKTAEGGVDWSYLWVGKKYDINAIDNTFVTWDSVEIL